ncbi:uncharacterized protein LOC126739885 [Anthonomus grandis grandis]|uniref:uncharacterized protein LOC126739885 n=1 Tax=Anthonomus grandis grandis TaxID=2921223 RepID=UPI0021660644|nr:uncharacterized protein LOC126739885 [Anthonomus grandis grandis]
MPVPFQIADDKKILKYIIDKKFECEVGGNVIWQKMAQEEVCPNRSWQSLKNRFKRYIKCDIGRPEFGLTIKEIQHLKQIWGLNNNTPRGGWCGKPLEINVTKSSTTQPKNQCDHLISDSSEDEGLNEELSKPYLNLLKLS